MRRKIIIDTDPGQDDAVAILLALGSPAELEIVGIVAVAGNVGLAQNAKNALKIVELSGKTDTPVYAGCERPMRRKLVTAEQVHGKTGLDGPDLPEPKIKLREQHGVDFIIETLRREPEGSVTLCTLGPLTNIGLAFQKAPDIVARVRELVMMGGGFFEGGNITPAAEFNIYVDPEAADIVFRSGVKLVMFGLNVTHQTRLAATALDTVRAVQPGASPVADIMQFYCNTYHAFAGADPRGAPLHDPCAIAYLIEPAIFSIEQRPGDVVVADSESYGQTLIDLRPQDPAHDTRIRNVGLAVAADTERFDSLVTRALIWAARRYATKPPTALTPGAAS